MASKRLRINSRNDDRISELPDYIFHNILSYLPSKDAARTSILSKTCLQAWKSYPNLDFNQSYFGKELPQQVAFWNCNTIVKGIPEAEKSLEKFIEFVDRSIDNFSNKELQFKRFKIFVSLIDPESFRLMKKWIGLAMKNLVEELDLSFGYRDPKRYILPQIVYKGGAAAAASSLKVLSLCNCKVSIHLSTVMKLSSIKKLHLKNVQFDKRTMDRLLAGCPYTEDLLLRFINGRKTVDLSGLKYLKSVDVESVSKSGELLIEAPNLEKLHCHHIQSLVFPTKRSSLLQDVYLSSVDSVTEQWLHNLIANSARIGSLEIKSCSNLEKLKISSDSLQKVEISGSKKLAIDVHALNLRRFSSNRELLFSSFRLTSPLCFASLYICNSSTAEWIELLSYPVRVMRLRLYVSRPPQRRFLRRVEQNAIPTVWQVEKMVLVAMDKTSTYKGLAEFLARSCMPKTLSIKYEGRGKQYASTINFISPSTPDAAKTSSVQGEISSRKLRSRSSTKT